MIRRAMAAALVAAALFAVPVTAKPAPLVPSLTVVPEVPTFGQVVTFVVVAELKPYEYPIITVRCFDDSGATAWTSTIYPTLGDIMVLGEGFSHYSAPSAACDADAFAGGGNRTHPGYARHLVGPVTFTAVGA